MAPGPAKPIPASNDAIAYLRALTIWFQLSRIGDENAAIRLRRTTESTQGPEAVPE